MSTSPHHHHLHPLLHLTSTNPLHRLPPLPLLPISTSLHHPHLRHLHHLCLPVSTTTFPVPPSTLCLQVSTTAFPLSPSSLCLQVPTTTISVPPATLCLQVPTTTVSLSSTSVCLQFSTSPFSSTPVLLHITSPAREVTSTTSLYLRFTTPSLLSSSRFATHHNPPRFDFENAIKEGSLRQIIKYQVSCQTCPVNKVLRIPMQRFTLTNFDQFSSTSLVAIVHIVLILSSKWELPRRSN
ncbi:hypothetical protein C3L33_17516, partial [Rhododendron williamsianum]